MWVLILIVFAANGVTSSTAYFEDREACMAAGTAMAREVGSLKNQPLIYVHCEAGASPKHAEAQ